MASASASAVEGDFADAALESTEAKMTAGAASLMSRTQDEMFASTLDMLV